MGARRMNDPWERAQRSWRWVIRLLIVSGVCLLIALAAQVMALLYRTGVLH